MIFEVSDFCLNFLNGKFFTSANILYSHSITYIYIFMIISLYVMLSGIMTYSLSYILLQFMLLFSVITEIHQSVRTFVYTAVRNKNLVIFLEGATSTIYIGIIISSLLYFTYKITASRKLSMANKFIYAYTDLISEGFLGLFLDIKKRVETVFILELVLSLVALHLCSRLIYKHTSTFTIFLFSYGGGYYFIKSLEALGTLKKWHWSLRYLMNVGVVLIGMGTQSLIVKYRKTKEIKLSLEKESIRMGDDHAI